MAHTKESSLTIVPSIVSITRPWNELLLQKISFHSRLELLALSLLTNTTSTQQRSFFKPSEASKIYQSKVQNTNLG